MNSKKIAMALLMSFSPSVFSQSYGTGGLIDYDRITNPTSDVVNLICDKYDDKNDYNACIYGMDGAKYMAAKYDRNAGKYVGCLKGYSDGLVSGYAKTKNTSPEQLDSANSEYSNYELSVAVDHGNTRASTKGQSVAADQIIKKFRAALKTNETPTPEYKYPTYSPELMVEKSDPKGSLFL